VAFRAASWNSPWVTPGTTPGTSSVIAMILVSVGAMLPFYVTSAILVAVSSILT
jgi:hypothetical protein